MVRYAAILTMSAESRSDKRPVDRAADQHDLQMTDCCEIANSFAIVFGI